MCGIIGVADRENAFSYIVEGLYQLQHRGEDSAGIAIGSNDIFDPIKMHRGVGLVENVFKNYTDCPESRYGIGHVRYSTSGKTANEIDLLKNAQPLVTDYPFTIAMAHNGNITNGDEIKQRFQELGIHLQTENDIEFILRDFANELKDVDRSKISYKHIFDAAGKVMENEKGGYAVTGLLKKSDGKYMVFAFADPRRIRPCVIGESDGSFMVSSESVVFDYLNYNKIDDLAPGEVVVIEDNKIEREIVKQKEPKYCQFEFTYFARPSSVINGVEINESRKIRGRLMGERDRESGIEIDVVIPAEKSGVAYAEGYAEGYGRGLKVVKGFDKNEYVGRYFIGLPQLRKLKLSRKINPIRSEIEGKKVLWIDDSIVRGETAKNTTDKLFRFGAKEIHFRTAVKVRSICPFGIDMTTMDQFFARGKTDKEIEEELGLTGKSSYRSGEIKDIELGTGIPLNHFCTGCLDENYAFDVSDLVKKSFTPGKRPYESGI